MVGRVEDVAGKKKFLVQREDGKSRETSYFFLLYVCSKERVVQEVNETIYKLQKNRR